MSFNDQIKGRVIALDRAVRPWAQRSPLRAGLYEFLLFGLKQAWACLFAAIMLGLLLTTHLLWPASAPIARYDFLVVAAILVQVALLVLKLEHRNEAVVIAVFHVVGTIMELFKTAHGSWIYPEPSLLRLGGVPLFSGFMYACIGSYIARIWRLFDIRFIGFPPLWVSWALAVAAYANFFSHHYILDLRWALFALTVLAYARTSFRLHPGPEASAHADAAGPGAGQLLHLAGREPRHLRQRLGLSLAAGRLASGAPGEDGELVSADPAQLRVGHPGAQAPGAGWGVSHDHAGLG